MRQELTIRNAVDIDNNPAGGYVHGKGIDIRWQDGPLRNEQGLRTQPNGAFVEDVLEACAARIRFYQMSRFRCSENAYALEAIQTALARLDSRTRDREKRGVEGTHAV